MFKRVFNKKTCQEDRRQESRADQPQDGRGDSSHGVRRIRRTDQRRFSRRPSHKALVTIEIENITDLTLSKPCLNTKSGKIYSPPVEVAPGQIERMIARKTSWSVHGTSGTVSWLLKIPRGPRRVVILWSIPFNLNPRPNIFAVGISRRGKIWHDPDWYCEIMGEEEMADIVYKVAECSEGVGEATIEDDQISVSVTMGDAHVSKMNVKVEPVRQ